jgi:hypothetical protein
MRSEELIVSDLLNDGPVTREMLKDAHDDSPSMLAGTLQMQMIREFRLAEPFARLRRMAPDKLAVDSEAARLVARLTRAKTKVQPVRVAAFNSYI